jgi:hypothetical protein
MSTEAPAVPTVAPGLHRDVPYDVYDRWDGVRHSVLRHFNRSALHAREAIVHPADQTEAQALGHAAHVAVLEPERFAREYVAAPKFDKRTTEGKRGWAAFQAEHEGFAVIPQEEHDVCIALRASVWAHPTASELLKGAGLNEASALWVDGDTGLTAKARIDRLTALAGWPVVVDLKTTRNASRGAFSRDVHTFAYHQQAGMYLDGLQVLAPHERKFVFIAIEKDPPYAVAVYELEEDALQLGRDEYQKHMAAYAECLNTNRWPSYGEGMDLISLPPWAFRAIED